MSKPLVYNYRKAEDRIKELEGIVIRQKLHIEHLEKKHKPMKVEGKYECPMCYWPLARSEESKELIIKEGIYNYCPYCGQKLLWK